MSDTFLVTQLQALRRYYLSGATRPYAFRKTQLEKLRQAVLRYETELHDALFADLKKSAEESWVTETGFLLSDIRATLKGLRSWMQPQRVPTNLLNLPSSSYIYREPLGVVLVIGPWNYPFQLLFAPLVGAIAGGNCVVLKPSEFAPHTDAVMRKIIEEIFPPEYVLYVTGDGAAVIPEMMNNFHFDHVFYTGSTTVGKIIYQMAARDLVPVTLELGGKSPCVVESDADLKVAARRIAVTTYSNAGQMCVAPDYVLVHESVKEAFLQYFIRAIKQFYTDAPENSHSYGKIINEKQFDRLVRYLAAGKIVYGGRHDRSRLFIEPTVLEEVTLQDPIMQEEIFGPIVPVLTFRSREEALAIIEQNRNPLAFYVFTSSRSNEDWWLERVSFGGGCVNNASWHVTNHHLPFGGRGFSGTGAYHGKHSFLTFTHQKSVLKTPTWFDPDLKYPPFKGKLRLFKMVIR
ncbi:MAG TPA: aldehyde dehydrogenase [Lacibacter sp.]|nr:aldehyde dehydrogenase [Lacibacter sp.]HMO88591.1 aldehyde dehydrogenase [Lacibacter sp.]